MSQTTRCTVLAAALFTAGVAHAAPIRIDAPGGSTLLNAGEFSSVTPWASSQSLLNNNVMQAMHAEFASAGIETDGVVTLFATSVDVDHNGTGDELGFFALVDGEQPGAKFRGFDARLGFSTSLLGDASRLVNDRGERIDVREGQDPAAWGRFDWDADEKGDAFGWHGLDMGESGEMDFFQSKSRRGVEGFQFLTWSAEGWEVALTGEFEDGDKKHHEEFGFQFAVVPIPGAVWMGMAGLAAVGAARRRMNRG